MARVILADRALRDIAAIETWSIEAWGKAVAEAYLDDIGAALDRLSEFPDLLRKGPAFASHVYFYRVRQHYVICDARDEAIFVLALVHCSMDLPARLTELEPTLAQEVTILRQKSLSNTIRESPARSKRKKMGKRKP